MNKTFLLSVLIALLASLGAKGYAQGKAPWTVTYHWITASAEDNGGQEIDAWLYGKKKVNHSTDEPRTICNGGITISYNDKIIAYVILNYLGKNAKGYIYNATYKQKGRSSVTGKLLVRMKGSIETGPSISIHAMPGLLEGCDVDGVELIGTPTALDD